MSEPRDAPSPRGTTAALAPRRTPEAYVRAEVAAFPLSAQSAFETALTELDPSLATPATAKLWRDGEEMLVEHASGWSLDRIVAVRDRSWFGEPAPEDRRDAPVPLHRYLRRLARDHLHRRAGLTEIRSGTSFEPHDAAAHYRWLTFALPEDLLLATVEADPPPRRVDLIPPLLRRRLLDRGVAEIHHHVGAGMDFPMLWASATAALADPRLPENALEGPGMPFDEGRRLVPWLLAAAVARTAVAEYLIRRTATGEGVPRSFAESRRHLPTDVWRESQQRLLFAAIRALAAGNADALPELHALQDLYAELHPEASFASRGLPQNLAEFWRRADPVAVRLTLTAPGAGEAWLVRRALAYLEEGELRDRPDELFAQVFWQIVRLRVAYYRAVVQRPMTAGLQWFIRFYDRIGKLRRPLDGLRAEASYLVAGGGSAIAALEVRTSPGPSPFGLAEGLSGLLGSWREVLRQLGTSGGGPRTEPEFGVVLHFVKGRDPRGDWRHGLPPAFGAGTYAEPQPERDVRPARYGDFLARRAVEARAFGELLRDVPRALWLVRGVDVASDELSVPTWALVPLYRRVLDDGDRAAADVRAAGAPTLRTTAHVGEDFRHLMEGLRRIFEAVAYLLDRAGSRLGHATALGIEPRSWAESVGTVLLPAEERLFDLVVEWRLYSGFRTAATFAAAAPPGREEKIKNEIRLLSGDVFGEPYDPPILAEAHHVLHGFLVPSMASWATDLGLGAVERAVRRLGPETVHYLKEVRSLLERYCGDEATFRRGQKLVEVPVDASEVAALEAVQDALRRAVGARGIVVEVNPSSNLLIGDLLDLRHHPILRLFPPEPGDGPPPVPIAIGSDDPLTFSTFLLREYALLFQAGRAAGYPERTVHAWLEAIRQIGMDARFTVAWRPDSETLSRRLLEAFDDYLQHPRRA